MVPPTDQLTVQGYDLQWGPFRGEDVVRPLTLTFVLNTVGTSAVAHYLPCVHSLPLP
jgi:hypothetical protein